MVDGHESDDAAADIDDWDSHWQAFGIALENNPARRYRSRLIIGLLGQLPQGSCVVDIGSGQGELALEIEAANPGVEVLGLEYSDEGVRRGRELAAAAGSSARFLQQDLLGAVDLEALGAERSAARAATCSEVLEHVDDPVRLLRNAAAYLQPGCRLVVTVPGGPMSAFDRSIGHRRHYDPAALSALLDEAGYDVERSTRAGFPFFNLYRLAVIAQGRGLADVAKGAVAPEAVPARQRLAETVFNALFRLNLSRGPVGWQIVAVATRRP